jgi:hypothetical protein
VLDAKLQLKEGQRIAVSNGDLPVAAPVVPEAEADVLVVFVRDRRELEGEAARLLAFALRGKTPWVAYPKARQLGTDLDRDSIHRYLLTQGLDAVRQIAVDEIWSAMRFKPAP